MADKAPGDDEFEKMIRERRATYRTFVNRMTRQQQAPAPPPEIRYVREGEWTAEEYMAHNLKPKDPTDRGHREKRNTYYDAVHIAGQHEVERFTPR